MSFKRSYCKKILRDSLEVIELSLKKHCGSSELLYVFEKDIKSLQDSLYSNYSIDKREIFSNKEFNELLDKYNDDLKLAKKQILELEVIDGVSYGKKSKSWVWRYMGSKYNSGSKGRIYINTKVGQLSNFVKRLIKSVGKEKIICSICGDGRIKLILNNKNKGFYCSKCGSPYDLFFKVHTPYVGQSRMPRKYLRYDKVVIYFYDVGNLQGMLNLLKNFPGKYFSSQTPYYTHQFKSGIGYNTEPINEEIKEYSRVMKEEKELISAGEYLTFKIAQHMVLICNGPIKSEKRLWFLFKKLGKSLNEKRELQELSNLFIRKYENKIILSLFSDKDFKRWLDRLSEINKEVQLWT